MNLSPPQAYRKTEFTHRIGLDANKPVASDVLIGTLYFSTDTLILERSNGISWDSYSSVGGGSIGLIGPPGLDGIDGKNDYFGFNQNQKLPIEVTLTNTGNIDDLDFQNADVIRFNNASLATIRGLKAGYPGQQVKINSVGAAIVEFAHQHTSSTTTNRLINSATIGNTPLAAGTGNCSYVYDGITQRWRLNLHNQGTWINQTYSAGDFTANGSMTWTVDAGDISTYSYYLNGRTLSVNINLLNTTVGGVANTALIVKVPGGFSAGVLYSTNGRVFDNGVVGVALFASNGAGIEIYNALSAGTVWTLNTNNTSIQISLSFPVA